MAKGLITAIGLVVSIGIVLLAVVLGALPIYLQSAAVDAQTATIANSNAVYQAQVDNLHAQQENLDAINASVAGLRAQIPATGQLDDVFEVIGRAAASADVAIVSISAGQQVAFTPHAGDVEDAAATTSEAPTDAASDSTDGTGTDGTATDGTADGTTDGAGDSTTEPAAPEPASGRQQVDFAIQVSASDMNDVTKFLDALRAGPRLLSSISATTVTGDDGITVQVSALTYDDAEG
jgi:hypothetical protein